MKVSDLVKWKTVPHQFAEVKVKHGIIVKMSRTGRDTESAQVLFTDGQIWWLDTENLEVVSENRG